MFSLLVFVVVFIFSLWLVVVVLLVCSEVFVVADEDVLAGNAASCVVVSV